MFGLSPLYPTNDLIDIFNSFDSFFNHDFLSTEALSPQGSFKVDVEDQGQDYIVEAEMPGIKKEEISLDYRNDTLYIGVQHEEDFNDDAYNSREHRYTSIQRGIYLKDVDINRADAKLEDGVLKIIAPKLYPSFPNHSIEIK